jgi:transglutaminase-like putative cysteine protease
MRLLIRHATRYRYDQAAQRLTCALRLWPADRAGLKVHEWSVSANDDPVVPGLDRRALWTAQPVPEAVEFLALGIVETRDVAGISPVGPRDPNPLIFQKSSALTAADAAIVALAAAAEGAASLDRLHALNALIHARLAYRSGSTTAATTAATALAQGAGVCQDHAHLFIAAARTMGVPARYVAGYLLAGPEGDELHETHAWAEAFVEGLGWVGFDASNGICPNEHYVPLTFGLDAFDAAPIRGHLTGGANIGVDADVRITPSQGEMGEQQQQEQQQQ